MKKILLKCLLFMCYKQEKKLASVQISVLRV